MPGMHETMARLYDAAKALKETEGQSAVARLLDELPQTLNNWETRGVSQQGAVKSQDKIGCDAVWLLQGAGEMRRTQSTGTAALTGPAGQLSASGTTGDPPELVIHQYGAGGAMGHGLILEDKQPGIIKSWHVDAEWLRLNVRHHSGIKNLCIVTGFGPSMRGMFNPGDPLLCDTGVTVCDTDAVYFFRVGDHGFIKMLQRIPTINGMTIRAKSKNPDYEPFDIIEGMDFQIFGKILTAWKSEQF